MSARGHDAQVARRYRHEHGFEWRGREVSRLEGLSDAVFGFAITLLVVSLEVPRDVHELARTLRGFSAFAVTFAMLFILWFQQYRFFRRYGLEDRTTTLLTAVLLFLVLFFIYPLKFLTQVVLDSALGGDRQPVRELATSADGALVWAAFGAGFTAVTAVLGALYLHAYREREALGLSPVEAFDTRVSWVSAFLGAGLFAFLTIWHQLVQAFAAPRSARRAWGLAGIAVVVAMYAWVIALTMRYRRHRRALLAADGETPVDAAPAASTLAASD
jgi:uncharacterized membrane protein